MTDFKERLKVYSKNKKNIAITIICVLLLILIVFGESGDKALSEDSTSEKASQSAADYTKQLEKHLEGLLEKVDGAGDVKVMITLESCYENVYAKGYSAQKEEDGELVQSNTAEEYIIVKNGSNTEECVVIKVYEPVIKGVAVVAEGAGNIHVKSAITETVCALFNISSAKVSVIKGYKE